MNIIDNLTKTEAEILARAGNLDYAQVRNVDHAIAARIGYEARANDESLSIDERRFAYDFVANLNCDWG